MKNNKIITFPQLTLTRFIAVLLTVIFHYGRHVYPFNNNSFFHSLAYFGNASVSYFFVLSGFVLIITYYKKNINLKRFYLKRLVKLYPIYLLTLLYYLIFSSDSIFRASFSLIKFFLNALLLQSWIPPFPLTLNAPAWFLSVLAFFYLIFPYINKQIRTWRMLKLSFYVISVWIISYALFRLLYQLFYTGYPSISHDLIYQNPLMHFNSFFIGIWGGVLFNFYGKSLNRYSILPILGILLSLLITIFIFTSPSPIIRNVYYYNGLVSPVFLFLILSLSLDKSIISSFVSKRIFISLGNMSLAMYLLQKPLMEIYKTILTKYNIPYNSPSFYIYLIFLIIISFIIHNIYERPLRKYIFSKIK